MTKQETIEILKSGDVSIYYDDHEEALNIAIECIERQMPKKPKEIIKRQVYDPKNPFATIDVTQFTCPCCDGKVMFRKTIKRCLECGQLLDWGDNE